MGEPTRHDIIVKYRDRREKFIYYLMGLDVAAIGFTLSKTYEIRHLQLNHIFLGIALFAWLLSILNAFRWLLTEFQGMQFDMHQYDINNGVVETWFKDGIAPEGYKEMLIEKLQKEMQIKSDRADRDYKRMLFLFMTGIVFFIMWRVLDVAGII